MSALEYSLKVWLAPPVPLPRLYCFKCLQQRELALQTFKAVYLRAALTGRPRTGKMQR